MKTTLFITALFAALAAKAQDTQLPRTPDPPAKTEAAPAKEKKKKDKPQACSDLPPDQQPRFKMPSAWQKALDKQRAEIERKTGISMPPPPPPKPLPPCPKPAPAKQGDEGKK